MNTVLITLAAVFGFTSLLLYIRSLLDLVKFNLRRIFFNSLPNIVLGSFFLLGAFLCVGVLSFNLLVASRAVAIVQTLPISEQYSVVRLYVPDGDLKQFNVRGDQWQLEANVIRVKPLMRLFGLEAVYQFDRLTGRYAVLNDELAKERSIYNLRSNFKGVDIARLFEELLPSRFVDSSYGSSTFVDMSDHGFYVVYLNNEGLFVKSNEREAKSLLKAWHE